MRRTGTSKTCVWRWQERFMQEGAEGLLRDKTRPSRIPALTLETVALVVARTHEAPPGETTHWTASLIRPIILAEVDDMAMLRLLAREREGVTLVPPIVVRDELESGALVEHCRIPQLTESFYAITLNRRFPNQLLGELLPRLANSTSS